MITLLFICHGNICRSPMAEFVMKELVKQQGMAAEFQIASCATSREEIGSNIHPGTRQKLKEKGIPFTARKARQLTAEDYETSHYLLAMDQRNLRNITHIIPDDPEHKIRLLLEFAGENRDIADPWYTGDFEATYQDIETGCNALLAWLINQRKN